MGWVVLDADEILRGLWQGGAPPAGSLVAEKGFGTLVLCAEEFQPASSKYPGVDVLRCPFDDSDVPLTKGEWEQIDRCCREIVFRVQKGQMVLVTCMAGVNRSGLVSALAVHKLTGVSGEEAVKVVQAGREHALKNEAFVAQLSRHVGLSHASRSPGKLRP